MNVVVAPDKFRGSLSQQAAAAAMSRGVLRASPGAAVNVHRLADGGEGSGEILAHALNATPRTTATVDALGQPLGVTWWASSRGDIAIVEAAQVLGLWRLSEAQRNPNVASSFGLGRLVLEISRELPGVAVWICIGGTATVDGGAGLTQALGATLLDGHDRPIAMLAGGAALASIHRVIPPLERPPLGSIRVLCDVRTPLLGPLGAAPMFGPQKGASAADVVELEAGLARWAKALQAATGKRVAHRPRCGAGGGIPAALYALLDAELCDGFETVADETAFDDALAGCDLCLTGEGRLDRQTLLGKVVAGVAARAALHGRPVIAFAGEIAPPPGMDTGSFARLLGVQSAVAIAPPGLGRAAAFSQAVELLELATASAVAEFLGDGART